MKKNQNFQTEISDIYFKLYFVFNVFKYLKVIAMVSYILHLNIF